MTRGTILKLIEANDHQLRELGGREFGRSVRLRE